MNQKEALERIKELDLEKIPAEFKELAKAVLKALLLEQEMRQNRTVGDEDRKNAAPIKLLPGSKIPPITANDRIEPFRRAIVLVTYVKKEDELLSDLEVEKVLLDTKMSKEYIPCSNDPKEFPSLAYKAKRGKGTGFLIRDRKTIMTADHVIQYALDEIKLSVPKPANMTDDAYQKFLYKHIRVVFLFRIDSNALTNGKQSLLPNCAYSVESATRKFFINGVRQHDVAYLTLTQDVHPEIVPRPLEFAITPPGLNDQLMTFGHAFGGPLVDCLKGEVLPPITQNLLQNSLDTSVGQSGSPVLNNLGKVVGLIATQDQFNGRREAVFDAARKCAWPYRCIINAQPTNNNEEVKCEPNSGPALAKLKEALAP